MEINKNSWHYKAVKFLYPRDFLVNGEDLPRMSLCEYTGTLIFLWPLFIAVMILLTPVWIIGLIIYGLSYIVPASWYEIPKKTAPIHYSVPEEEPKSLIGKWLWTKKRKVCPILKWVDEEKKNEQ